MLSRSTIRAICIRALEGGGKQLTPYLYEWNISGKCETPYRAELWAKPIRDEWVYSYRGDSTMSVEDTFNIADASHPDWLKPRMVRIHTEQHGPYAVLLSTKCRKCESCLEDRAQLWAARARFEVGAASRTWFATLTLAPEWHSVFGDKCRSYCDKRGENFDALPSGEQFALRHKFIAAEIQKMFKRMRKADLHFRYLLVVEPHTGKLGVTEQTGMPHYHMLLHEMGSPIRKRELETYWPYGHSQWRLVEEQNPAKAAWYAAKYLAKTSIARVRASVRYGGGL